MYELWILCKMVEMSALQEAYFASIESELDRCYVVGNAARAKGYDIDTTVSIPVAKDMAERVEGLISVVAPQLKGAGLSQRIQALEAELGSQNWKIAFLIALEVAQQKFCSFSTEHEALEVALRVGLMYITNGVVASPLEGFIRLELKERLDGSGKFFSLYFGGPIRSAGTTATCIFVACCDYVRKEMGYVPYDPTEAEIKRSFCEVEYFHERVTNLQYFPSEDEVTFLATHLPVQIEGDASEKFEVPNYKKLPRVSTDFMRNGFCLVMAEGLSQKSKKFWGKFSKWYTEFGMDHWKFLDDYVALQKKVKSKGQKAASSDSGVKIAPDYTYIKDLVAGRPILCHPLRHGGFRLRYGRGRNSGFSTDAIHPATMLVLDSYVAIGTQLKLERPAKATSLAVCDTIMGPVVKLTDGSVVCVETEEEARSLVGNIAEVLYLGDILINYGDFFNRAHTLLPPGYCAEWWALELAEALGDDLGEFASFVQNPFSTIPSFADALRISQTYTIPLHPTYTFFWKALSVTELLSLLEALEFAVVEDEKLILPFRDDAPFKRALELLGVPHQVVSSEHVVIFSDAALALRCSLGFLSTPFSLETAKTVVGAREDVLDVVNDLAEVFLKDTCGYFIGARMGRPEKAKMRKMTGSPQVLFPVGDEGGRLRSFQAALEKGHVNAQFSVYSCTSCSAETVYPVCHSCGSLATPLFFSRSGSVVSEDTDNALRYKDMSLPIHDYYAAALSVAALQHTPQLIKGVRGTGNRNHAVEHLVKGLLRAAHQIYINKDGTVRYDMTEMTLTHFKPHEIGTSVARLLELGYTVDVQGNPLVSADQILELKCQDFLLPMCPDALEEGGGDVFFRVTQFVDDLLVKLYGQDPYYNLKEVSDIVGHLFIGLSPHTCAGIVCRAIGFSKSQTLLAHPYLHSIMRRDTDGDEAGVMLLMDALLNFSRHLLGSHRGATQDEPLVLTSRILPGEVDDMVFDMDVVWQYPLSFYRACEQYKTPYDLKFDQVADHLGKASQYEGFGFTHDTTSINAGALCSGYKTLPTLQEKVAKQMELAERLRCVDTSDVARLVVERHFIRDIKGNLGKFSRQQFRCVGCNAKYRRPPLTGHCTCGGKLIFTIHEGSVVKYLEPSLSLADRYDLPSYLKQTLELTKLRIEHVFGKDPERQEGLGKWFG